MSFDVLFCCCICIFWLWTSGVGLFCATSADDFAYLFFFPSSFLPLVVFICMVFNACNSACVSKYTAGLKPGKRRRGCKLFGLVLGKVMIIACCLIWDIFQQRFVTCADVVALLKDIKIFPVCVLKRSS